MTNYTHAFVIPGSTNRVLPVSVSDGAARLPLSTTDAHAQGLKLLAWPLDSILDRPIPAHELASTLPLPPSAEHVALSTKLERAARITTQGADFGLAVKLAGLDMPEAKARGFLRGLPVADITPSTTTTKDTSMHYQNQPSDEKSAIRGIEIRIAGIEARANHGDLAAKAKAREIAYARSVAAASGRSLIATLASLNISLA